MGFYVYILQSEIDNTFYKGFTENVQNRLAQHNNGEGKYSSTKMPWKLVYVEEFTTKREALIREKQIKRFNSTYLKRLIDDFKYNSVG